MTMKPRHLALLCTAACSLFLAGWSMQSGSDAPPAKATTPVVKAAPSEAKARRLHKEMRKLPSEVAQSFVLPLVCDADGNLYLRTIPDGIQAIHKLNSQGERIGLYQAKSANVKVNFAYSLAVAPDGDIYQLVAAAREITRYVFVYNKDGSVKSEIKLQPGFPITPSKIAVFPNGDLLVAGMEYDKDSKNPVMWPFTGIFSSDGTLRRELTLKDDQKLHDLAASGDPKVSSPDYPSSFNTAVGRGDAQTASDGNVYLMRRLSRPIFYAISPGGSVRRFEVDSGQEDFVPQYMHISGNRIAIMFQQPQTYEEIIEVVDLEGHRLATYYETAPKEGEQTLGLGFACYSQNPERFTFLETTEDNRLGIITATPE